MEEKNIQQPRVAGQTSAGIKNAPTVIGEKLDQNSVSEVDDPSDLQTAEKTSSFDSHPLTHSPAIKSTGPRTEIGKAIASKNALKHGIFSNAILATSEWRDKYDSLLAGLWEHFEPVGAIEEVLVEKLAVLIWRYRRLIMTETAEIKGTCDRFFFDFNSGSQVLHLFPRYEASIERSFDRTLTQLERIQRMRLGLPVAPLIKVDVAGRLED